MKGNRKAAYPCCLVAFRITTLYLKCSKNIMQNEYMRTKIKIKRTFLL
jgi:hypothetical protein